MSKALSVRFRGIDYDGENVPHIWTQDLKFNFELLVPRSLHQLLPEATFSVKLCGVARTKTNEAKFKDMTTLITEDAVLSDVEEEVLSVEEVNYKTKLAQDKNNLNIFSSLLKFPKTNSQIVYKFNCKLTRNHWDRSKKEKFMMFALKITLEEFVAYVRLYALKTSRNMQKGKDATIEMVAQSTEQRLVNNTSTSIKEEPSSEEDWSTELSLTADFLKNLTPEMPLVDNFPNVRRSSSSQSLVIGPPAPSPNTPTTLSSPLIAAETGVKQATQAREKPTQNTVVVGMQGSRSLDMATQMSVTRNNMNPQMIASPGTISSIDPILAQRLGVFPPPPTMYNQQPPIPLPPSYNLPPQNFSTPQQIIDRHLALYQQQQQQQYMQQQQQHHQQQQQQMVSQQQQQQQRDFKIPANYFGYGPPLSQQQQHHQQQQMVNQQQQQQQQQQMNQMNLQRFSMPRYPQYIPQTFKQQQQQTPPQQQQQFYEQHPQQPIYPPSYMRHRPPIPSSAMSPPPPPPPQQSAQIVNPLDSLETELLEDFSPHDIMSLPAELVSRWTEPAPPPQYFPPSESVASVFYRTNNVPAELEIIRETKRLKSL